MLKFIKLLRFNKTIRLLTTAIGIGMKELFGVFVIFAIVFMAYVQTFYLALNDKVYTFNNILSSMGTSFQILLGKFDMDQIIRANPVLGIILFISFNLSMLMIVLNLIITSISDTFTKVKENSHEYLEGTEMTEYVKERFNEILTDYKKGELLKKKVYYEEETKPSMYVENSEQFEINVQKLMHKVKDVSVFFWFYSDCFYLLVLTYSFGFLFSLVR